MPDGIVLYQCKTCTKVKAVLVPVPPCLYLEQHHNPNANWFLEFGVKLQHLKAQENLNAAYIYDICSRE